MEQRKRYERVWCWGPCSVEQLSRGRWEYCACPQGRKGVNLGRTISSATLSALNIYGVCTMPGTDSNNHVWGSQGGNSIEMNIPVRVLGYKSQYPSLIRKLAL